MDKLLLKLVALFRHMFTKQGIDYERMMTIVKTKLIMDKRRVYMNWKQRQQKKESSNHLNGVLLMYGFMGIFIGVTVGFMSSIVLAMIILHAYILFMMSMTLITDFSTVLLDTTDNQVILPKPISGKTLFMARLVHIMVYLLQFTLALSIIPIIACFIAFGPIAGLVTIFTLLLTVLLAVFITYFLYLFIIRFSSESKIKDIVSYFQIFMTILFTAGFQILPRIINLSQLEQTFELHWYAYLLPPVWMALTVETFASVQFDILHIGMVVAAFVVPLFTFWYMIKYLAPSFSKKLGALQVDTSNSVIKKTDVKKEKKDALSQKLSAVVCSSPLERSTFHLTWKMTGRDKSFKLQFYPSMAYILVFIFIIVFNNGRNLASQWSHLSSSRVYIFLFYIPMMTVSGSIILIAFNENYLASWVYHSLPIYKPGELIAGSIKALFIKFFIPIFCFLLAFAIYIWGPQILDDALFAFANNMMCFLIFANFSDHYLPFSRQPNTQQQSGKFIKTLLQLLIVAVTVGLHYLLMRLQLSWLLLALTPVMIAAAWLLQRRLQNLPWQRIAI